MLLINCITLYPASHTVYDGFASCLSFHNWITTKLYTQIFPADQFTNLAVSHCILMENIAHFNSLRSMRLYSKAYASLKQLLT